MSIELITAAEVAKQLNVDVRTLHRLRMRGEGPPAYRIGRTFRFRSSEVEEWLQSQALIRSAPAREEVKAAAGCGP
jgi:excisionase family DNA binding protein